MGTLDTVCLVKRHTLPPQFPVQSWLVALCPALTPGVGDGDGDPLHLDPVDADGLHRLSGRRQLRRVQRQHAARRGNLGQRPLLPAARRRPLDGGDCRRRQRHTGGHRRAGGGGRRGDGVLELDGLPLAGRRFEEDLSGRGAGGERLGGGGAGGAWGVGCVGGAKTGTCVGVDSVGETCRLDGAAWRCGTGGSVAEAACTTFKACWGIWTTWDSGLGCTTWTCCTTAGWPGLCTISRLFPAYTHS